MRPEMPLTLKIVSEHASLVGDDFVREFGDDGGTIGRGLQNDWILPDPDRYISGRHATIDHQGGIYYLADTSSNGVYVNDEHEPIGNGNPRRLFDGDRLRMGDFLFEVALDSGESLVMPLDDDGGPVVNKEIDQMVDEDSLTSGEQLLDEEAITGDGEFQSALFGTASQQVDDEPEDQPVADTGLNDVFAKAEPKPAPAAVKDDDLLDSFLDGIELSRADLGPAVDRAEFMHTAGQILRELVQGTSNLLASRANLKKAFRLDQTTILPRDNNPMKFSANTTGLLKQLLTGGTGDYLGPRDAIREVNQDLVNHQNAFLDAMAAAFVEFADRFAPAELQKDFDNTLGDGLLSFANKSKYWQLYCDLYPIITEKGNSRFPQMFAEEFISAYERQIAEFRRRGNEGLDPVANSSPDTAVYEHLRTTQRIGRPKPEVKYEDERTDPLSDSVAEEIDQDFIDELENSMIEDAPKGRLKA